ncbi:MAG: hydrogenase maturation nickel metallochaperone HypA [Lachnospiraceae bacterium]|nr:hydrogenase maturation nickel metallochaperone HypA [Lachnospiraceae bacterium]
MTLVPEYRRCKNCGKRFSFNPDVGNIMCPYCGSLMGKKNFLSGLTNLGSKKSSKNDNSDNNK